MQKEGRIKIPDSIYFYPTIIGNDLDLYGQFIDETYLIYVGMLATIE